MPGASSRRLQLKADLTDLFRGSSNTVVPSTGEQDVQDISSEKKRSRSRIPFVGRSNRKSMQSDVPPLPTAEHEMRRSRTSAVTSERPNILLDEQAEALPAHPRSSVSQSSLHAPSLLGAQSSIGTKIAAHLAPSRSFGLKIRKSMRRRAGDKSSGNYSGSLSDTSYPSSRLSHPSSTDVTFIQGSRRDQSPADNSIPSQSSTSLPSEPQFSQPTITVSSPPTEMYDELDEFKDLFTQPLHKSKQKPSPIAIISGHSGSEGSLLLDGDSPSPNREVGTLSLPAPSPERASQTTSGYSTASTDASSTIGRSTPKPRAVSPEILESRNAIPLTGESDHASLVSRRSLSSRRQSFFAAQQQLHLEGRAWSEAELDSAEESEAVSFKSARSMPSSSKVDTTDVGAGLTLTQRRKTLNAVSHRSKSAERSRRGLSGLQIASVEPPSIPLPSPPPQLPLPDIPLGARTDTPRRRAHTMVARSQMSRSLSLSKSAVLKRHHTTSKALGDTSPLAPVPAEAQSNRPSPYSTLTLTDVFPKMEPIQIDVDSASPDQLREALHRQNKRYEELSQHISKAIETHAAEKAVVEERIAHLEREVMRKDKEIKGLTWLVVNSRSSSGAGSRGPMETSDDLSARSLPPSSTPSRLRPFHGEDSGTENYPTSATDWGSGRSDAEESLSQGVSYTSRARKGMKKLKLVESANKASSNTPSSSAQGPSSQSISSGVNADHDVPSSSLLRPSKRSSVSSVLSSSGTTVISSASSTSSRSSPTSVVFPSPSVLSAIPESRPASASSNKSKGKERTISPSVSERDDCTRERRPSKPSLPLETTSPRLTPSEAYARNLRTGRPPSIAQVLDRTTSVAIEESYGGRSRALLAGMTPSTLPHHIE